MESAIQNNPSRVSVGVNISKGMVPLGIHLCVEMW